MRMDDLRRQNVTAGCILTPLPNSPR